VSAESGGELYRGWFVKMYGGGLRDGLGTVTRMLMMVRLLDSTLDGVNPAGMRYCSAAVYSYKGRHFGKFIALHRSRRGRVSQADEGRGLQRPSQAIPLVHSARWESTAGLL